MIISIDYEVTSCKDCPFLEYRDGACNGGFGDIPPRIPVCKKGYFGYKEEYCKGGPTIGQMNIKIKFLRHHQVNVSSSMQII